MSEAKIRGMLTVTSNKLSKLFLQKFNRVLNIQKLFIQKLYIGQVSLQMVLY